MKKIIFAALAFACIRVFAAGTIDPCIMLSLAVDEAVMWRNDGLSPQVAYATIRKDSRIPAALGEPRLKDVINQVYFSGAFDGIQNGEALTNAVINLCRSKPKNYTPLQ